MSNYIVSQQIRRHIWPLLRDEGFTRFSSRKTWRYSEDQINIIDFKAIGGYAAGVLDVTTFSFALELGTFLTWIPPVWPPGARDGGLRPEVHHCQFTGRIIPSLPDAQGQLQPYWRIDPQRLNLAGSVQDVVRQIPQLLAWFERLRDRAEVLRILEENEEDMVRLWGFGRLLSPQRSYLTGYVALAMGADDLASRKLGEAVQSGCFEHLFASVEGAMRRGRQHR